jgi:hypothetical protein
MWRTYRSLAGRDGAPALIVAGLLTRSAIATYPIGLLMLLGSGYRSLAVAGLATGAYGVAAVVAGPVAGRWYDAVGPARLLPLAAAAQLTAIVMLAIFASAALPVPVLLVASALLGLLVPQAGVLVRARWAVMLRGSDDLPAALFLEGALDEATFVVGPLLMAGLGRLLGPAVAVAMAGLITAVGALLLARLPWAEPVGHGGARLPPPRTGRVGSRQRLGAGFPAVCVAFVAVGAVFGCVQVGVFATTRDAGAPGAAGPVLAAFSVVSLAAGLLAGRAARGCDGSGAALRRYRRVLVVLAAGMLMPAIGPIDPMLLAALLSIAACAASPAVAAGYALAERFVPPSRLMEGLGYAGAALGLGLAAGTAVSGLAADFATGRAVFALGSAFGVLGVLAALAVAVAPDATYARTASAAGED